MQPLDRRLQRRVWNRVYGNFHGILSKRQRERLQRCLRCSMDNLAFYEGMSNHNLYADAFIRLAAETKEQIKMLRQMLQM